MNSFSELVTTFGEMFGCQKKILAFLFNFHLDCGKHFVTFSKQIEIRRQSSSHTLACAGHVDKK